MRDAYIVCRWRSSAKPRFVLIDPSTSVGMTRSFFNDGDFEGRIVTTDSTDDTDFLILTNIEKGVKLGEQLR